MYTRAHLFVSRRAISNRQLIYLRILKCKIYHPRALGAEKNINYYTMTADWWNSNSGALMCTQNVSILNWLTMAQRYLLSTFYEPFSIVDGDYLNTWYDYACSHCCGWLWLICTWTWIKNKSKTPAHLRVLKKTVDYFHV